MRIYGKNVNEQYLPIEELASHVHSFYVGGYSGWGVGTANLQKYVFSNDHALNTDGTTYTGHICQDRVYPQGGDVPHNNMEPYKVVYIFRRTV